jgi:colanic acid/amylovoran biosynthesis glycosyltransferase
MNAAPRLRIALLAGCFPKLSETFVLQQVCSLLALGHDVRIFSFDRPRETVFHPEVQRLNLLARTTYVNGPKNVKTRLRVLWSRLSRTPAQSFDAIVCHFGPMGEHGRALRELGLIDGKLAVYFHAYDLTAWFKKHPTDYYARLFEEADLLLPISEHWRSLLLRLGAPAHKLRVRHMGVDSTSLHFSPRALAADEPLRLISVARLIEKKGLSYAFAALALAEKQLPRPFEYHVVGDGPLRSQLQSEADALGLRARVTFHGSLDSAAVQGLMQGMHGFLAPSVTAADGDMEGIPVALMEAMAQGLPVISTRHSGIPELVRDGETGWCVPERDATALAKALVEWANAPAGWVGMARRARNLVEAEFDMPTLAQQLADDLRAVASPREPA